MSDLAGSSTPIQSEATRFRSSVSENLLQTMGGAINYLLASILPLGSVTASMLTEAQFQDETSTGWVLADGRDVSASDYALLTGNTTVPDLRGVFIRGKNGARSTSTGNAGGDVALGTFQADAVQEHQHYMTATNVVESGGPIVHDDGSEFAVNSIAATGNMASGNISTETKPRSVTLNYFIRIN